MSCSNITQDSSELNLLEEKASSFLGRQGANVQEQFSDVSNLHFKFLERVSGQSDKVYDLFSADEKDNQILVAFELQNGTVQGFHIRSYIKSQPKSDYPPNTSASCFLDPKEYFEFVQKKLPVGKSSIDDTTSFSEIAGLFLHRESIGGSEGEMVFLQEPFPLDSFEADIGANISPNIPNGFCVIFDPKTRQIMDFKMPYQCNLDMALLSRQIEETLGEGN